MSPAQRRALRDLRAALRSVDRDLRALTVAVRRAAGDPHARMSWGRRRWTAEEDARLRRLYPNTQTKRLARVFKRSTVRIYARANVLGLHKSAAYLASADACRLRRGDNVGAAYRFPKGHVPANKGLRRPGWAPGRMRETQFKKGNLTGAANRNWVPVGTEVLDPDGYRKRKVSSDHTVPSRRNWKFVHVIVWEKKHGPVPPGHAVAFRNGDKSDIRLGNLELLSREDLMRRNTVHRLPKELRDLVMLRAAVVRQIRRKSA